MSNEQGWQAWDWLQKKQWMLAYGCSGDLADDLLRRVRQIQLHDEVRLESIMRAWGVAK